MMPKRLSHVAVGLALFAFLWIALPAVGEPAGGEPAAGEELSGVFETAAPVCEATGVLSLEDSSEPLAMSCTTCPAEAHSCTDDADCDAYCTGCGGNCVVTRYSVCPWIDVPFPRVCQCL